jgi:hypothetical protein
VAVVETLIAVPVILGFARKPTYISAIASSVMIWATAEASLSGPAQCLTTCQQHHINGGSQ